MSPASLALRDSATMLRRDLRHAQRLPMMTASGILVPDRIPAAVRGGVRPR